MRSAWGRVDEPIGLDLVALTALIQPAFPTQVVVRRTATVGGLANTNLRLDLSAHPDPVLLRLCTRPIADYETESSFPKEIALHGMLAPTLPVPRVLHAAASNAVTGHPYMLIEWVDGERLEVAAHRLSATDLAELAFDVGAVLAGIHAVTFPAGGMLNGALEVTPFPPAITGGLVEFLRYLLGEPGPARLGPDLLTRLMAFAEREKFFGAEWQREPCLTHADFGGSNILVRGARVAGVIDWEFAFSGAPSLDFGNLLRPPLGDLPGFQHSVAAGYRAAGGELPDNWRKHSLYVDLTAWAGFLGRPQITDALVNDARTMIKRTLDTWTSL